MTGKSLTVVVTFDRIGRRKNVDPLVVTLDPRARLDQVTDMVAGVVLVQAKRMLASKRVDTVAYYDKREVRVLAGGRVTGTARWQYAQPISLVLAP